MALSILRDDLSGCAGAATQSTATASKPALAGFNRRGVELHLADSRSGGSGGASPDNARNTPGALPDNALTEVEVAAIGAVPVTPVRAALGDEITRARDVQRRAFAVVKSLLLEAKLGRPLGVHRVAPVIDEVTASVLRNPGALLGLSTIRSKSDYTFHHSVSVCTLLVAFCHFRGMDRETMYQAGLGGLLHDIGKARIPDHVLNKRGALTEDERQLVCRHPRDGVELLSDLPGIGDIPLDITLHHHERFDGGGYPDRLDGARTSELAQMAAIVDVYSAITADSCYRPGIAPAQALRNMYEWGKSSFNPSLTQEFIRCIGIYPVGTLVMLESGRLAVVVEPHETNLLTPKVKVFFNTLTDSYLKPTTIDLAGGLRGGGADRIKCCESPSKWKVAPMSIASLA